jgi:hypothetical protein
MRNWIDLMSENALTPHDVMFRRHQREGAAKHLADYGQQLTLDDFMNMRYGQPEDEAQADYDHFVSTGEIR